MNKQLKHQIKQDELVTGVQKAAAFLNAHQQEAKVTVAAAVVAALAIGGFTFYRQGREAEAARAFGAALETFRAPVAGDPSQEAAPGAVRFASASEKYKKAVGEFDGVHRRYGSMEAGRRARYYAALCRLELGEVAEAEKALTEISSGDKSTLEPALARLALADVHRRSGKLDQAVAEYQKMIDDANLALPRDHVLMALSHALEEARRLPEAGASYRRLADEFPGSPYAAEARERADYLEGASRG